MARESIFNLIAFNFFFFFLLPFRQILVLRFSFASLVAAVASSSIPLFSVLASLWSPVMLSLLTSSAMPPSIIISFSAPVPLASLSISVLLPVSIPRSISVRIPSSAPLISSPASLGSLGSPAAVEWRVVWWTVVPVAELISWISVHVKKVAVLASWTAVSLKETYKQTQPRDNWKLS